ncbi:MAG: flagellar filament capping protein FliD [Sulfuricurvum sp.]|nr:flagellar filament capping protein FliD [Sulfuricurvum sp.]
MAGTINSLGIGSGVLTSDIIDKLKANDVANVITPIDNKITLQKQKSSALSLLSSLLTTFQTSASALNDDSIYQKRNTSGSTSSVSVTANTGVSVQSFSISNTQLALKNVKESGSFSATSNTISSGTGIAKLSIGTASYDINYTATTTLDELKDSINNIAGASVKASTLQVGTNDYRLILTSAQTGATQTINISDSAGGTLNTSLYASSKKIESQAFTASTDLIASTSGNLTVAMGTNNYVINYDTTTTLETLLDSINTAAGATIASIDSNNKLVLQSSIAGSSSALTLTDNSAGLDSKLTSYTTYNPLDEIQAARDASFKYDGITLTRSTNEIKDLIVGANINLLQDSGSANISITQDTEAISDELNTFVQSYNTLTSQLTAMTTTDVAAGKVGIFNGDNSINSISREINRLITSSTNGLSLPDFGIDLSQTGNMSFNSSTFLAKFNTDPSASETFLSGKTTVESNGNIKTVDGVFTSMQNLLENYTKSDGSISTLASGSSNEYKALTLNKTRSQALLDARYATMAARFSQYDSLISKLNSQFSSLQMQIDAMASTN